MTSAACPTWYLNYKARQELCGSKTVLHRVIPSEVEGSLLTSIPPEPVSRTTFPLRRVV